MWTQNLEKEVKKKTKTQTRKGSFFSQLSKSLHEVAPLEWIPSYYQDQIRAAKPVSLYKPRLKKIKAPLH